MEVFEITKPGNWLDGIDRDATRVVEEQLDHLVSQFFDANVALNHFNEAIAARRIKDDEQMREREDQRRSEIYQQVEREKGGGFSRELMMEIDFETNARLSRERWNQGRGPKTFAQQLPFIYARAFLYAFDNFEKFLGKIVKDQIPVVSPALEELHAEFIQCFPDLGEVRNSAHHMEDRSRGIGKPGKNAKPMVLQPIDNPAIGGSGDVLVMSAVVNLKFGNTMANGHYGEVEVSAESMRHLQRILQRVLDSFKWKGSKLLLPSN